MSRPSHRTASDVRFRALTAPHDNLRQLDEIVELTDRIHRAAAARGVRPDLAALEALDDDDTLDDAEALDGIRGTLRAHLGEIERGEHAGGCACDE
jgi:predicted RNA polymerase sigma factor